jgi:hypothetical protein
MLLFDTKHIDYFTYWVGFLFCRIKIGKCKLLWFGSIQCKLIKLGLVNE